MIYLHDGSLDGFLTCVFKHYYEQKVTGIYENAQYLPQLFEEYVMVETDSGKAKRVYDAIVSKFSEETFWDVYRTFLSSDPMKDCYLLSYLEMAFKIGDDINRLFGDPVVHRVKKISRQVGFEKHRFLGLLRFMDVKGYLYARFEPDHDVLELLAEHFVDRFKGERFIIHDVKRHKAVISNYGEWLITSFDLKEEVPISEEEALFQSLWQVYFESIGIEGRKNPKLQQQFVPLKYRKHLLEFN